MPASFRALPLRLARRARRFLEHAVLGRHGVTYLPIGAAHAGGRIEGVEVGSDGILAVLGWAPERDAFAASLRVRADGVELSPSNVFGATRADLARIAGQPRARLGLVVEFVLPAEWSKRRIEVRRGEEILAEVSGIAIAPTPYAELYGNPGVRHREHIYAVGPPVRDVSNEILELCAELPGPLLDFGCGSGALVERLRSLGIEASGLELDAPAMRSAVVEAARPFVSFYDGRLPWPVGRSGAFASVTCCEVLEHVADYEAVVLELARLAQGHVLITVPDMSGIPRGAAHGVVPWHLLESTHVNFFTQQSLRALLAPHFSKVEFIRIGEVRCDRVRFYMNLVALCRK